MAFLQQALGCVVHATAVSHSRTTATSAIGNLGFHLHLQLRSMFEGGGRDLVAMCWWIQVARNFSTMTPRIRALVLCSAA